MFSFIKSLFDTKEPEPSCNPTFAIKSCDPLSPPAPLQKLPLNEPSCLVKGITKSLREHPEEWTGEDDKREVYTHYFSHAKTGCKIKLIYQHGRYLYINGKRQEDYRVDLNQNPTTRGWTLDDITDALAFIPGTQLYQDRVDRENEKKVAEVSKAYFEPLGCPDKNL